MAVPPSNSPRPASFEGDTNAPTASVDALLKDDERRSPSTTPTPPDSPRRSSLPSLYASGLPSSTSAPRPQLSYLLALLLLSTTSANTLPNGALQHRQLALALPIAQYALLSLAAALVGCAQPNGKFGRARRGEDGRRGRIFAGGLCALASIAGILQARWLEGKVWEAMEVFILPLLLFLPTIVPMGLSAPIAPPAFLACTASAFLVAFSLVGVTASGAGWLLALGKVGLEAVRWMVLKKGMTGERGGAFLVGTGVCALAASTTVFVISGVLPTDFAPPLHRADTLFLVLHIISSFLESIVFLLALNSFPTPTTTASVFLPRNFLLIFLSSLGRPGIGLGGNWLQMAFVLAAGSAVVAWADPDVRPPGLRGRGYPSDQDWERGDRPPNGHIRLASTSAGSPPPTSPTSKRFLPSPRPPAYPNSSSTFSPYLSLLPFLPLLLCLFHSQSPTTSASLATACAYLPPSVRSSICFTNPSPPIAESVDLVFAYWEEDLVRFRTHLDRVRENDFVKTRKRRRVIVYNKGGKNETEIRASLKLVKGVDQVVALPNAGREGGTYLRHILLHYNASMTPSPTPILREHALADHTFFFQPHLAWHWIAKDRIAAVGPDTGFAHFGPLIRSDCGIDIKEKINFPVVKELFSIFTGQLCPPTGQLTAWSGQFVVSKRRILANSYEKYAGVSRIIEAPADHWIHKMWGPNGSGGPANPAVGHSLERAWPFIFGCGDPKMADECTDDVAVKAKCQCLDY